MNPEQQIEQQKYKKPRQRIRKSRQHSNPLPASTTDEAVANEASQKTPMPLRLKQTDSRSPSTIIDDPGFNELASHSVLHEDAEAMHSTVNENIGTDQRVDTETERSSMQAASGEPIAGLNAIAELKGQAAIVTKQSKQSKQSEQSEQSEQSDESIVSGIATISHDNYHPAEPHNSSDLDDANGLLNPSSKSISTPFTQKNGESLTPILGLARAPATNETSFKKMHSNIGYMKRNTASFKTNPSPLKKPPTIPTLSSNTNLVIYSNTLAIFSLCVVMLKLAKFIATSTLISGMAAIGIVGFLSSQYLLLNNGATNKPPMTKYKNWLTVNVIFAGIAVIALTTTAYPIGLVLTALLGSLMPKATMHFVDHKVKKLNMFAQETTSTQTSQPSFDNPSPQH